MTRLSLAVLLFVIPACFLVGCRVDYGPERSGEKPVLTQHKLERMYYEPIDTTGKVPGVIVLGGSEGGINSAAGMAGMLKYHCGVGALAVAYFHHKSLPKDLELIPLEYVAQAIDVLKAKPDIDSNRIGIMGVSKGGELALLMASHYSDIRFVVAYVPSNVVFQGIQYDWNPADHSSWRFQDSQVPFLPYAMLWEVKGNEIVDLFEASLKNLDEHEDAIIPVENINGPILLVSGEDDRLWPSTWMCDRIVERLHEKHFQFDCQHLALPNTGHFVTGPSTDTTYGGTAEGNYAGGEASQNALKEFMKKVKEN